MTYISCASLDPQNQELRIVNEMAAMHLQRNALEALYLSTMVCMPLSTPSPLQYVYSSSSALSNVLASRYRRATYFQRYKVSSFSLQFFYTDGNSDTLFLSLQIHCSCTVRQSLVTAKQSSTLLVVNCATVFISSLKTSVGKANS